VGFTIEIYHDAQPYEVTFGEGVPAKYKTVLIATLTVTLADNTNLSQARFCELDTDTNCRSMQCTLLGSAAVELLNNSAVTAAHTAGSCYCHSAAE